ncbi:heavy metal translocating P-type ATPase [Beijerinckia indica]|uniref:P-type Zn(2+) transporter n=1 Tax=Beijerinckia indica subsp. indica (strain ATCC 9039 / DSM 1715 / NCIMB 8712) TaxID=395963 RepID=B2ICN5_BEII9|nr:heavy metal translocating P-type ATPase [Beijerinckia indica]ACB93924.1 heavy metal translocating P-type ATPase [Beijerinckia indica subsp. indica ATCC 9039]
MASASILKLRVEGMDCGACALKIEAAMRSLPGVADIAVDYHKASLSLTLDEDRSSRAVIEARIRALGYTPIGDGVAVACETDRDHGPRQDAWWASRKGRLVITTGVVLSLATIIAYRAPEWSYWAYGVATLAGLLPLSRRALAGARSGVPFSIETLMTIATAGAIAIGEAQEAAVIVFLFAVGELLEGIAADRARTGIKALTKLLPRQALRLHGANVEMVSVETLAVGDHVVVRPGDRIPSDGFVVEGMSEVDEAPVTGESMPVAKETGAIVYAGSINANGELRVEITRTAADNTIARIIHKVEEAQASKAPTARLIDRFSRLYTPFAMAAAGFVVLMPPLFFGADWFLSIYRGLAVLLIACPCALVVSTPTAIASGLASGARHGLLIKGGAALETLSRVQTIAFDKTGTLTLGHPQVTDVLPIHGSVAEILVKAAAVERGSSHPLGVAIVAEAEKRHLALPECFGGGIAIPGKAMMGRLKSGFVWVESPRHAAAQTALADNNDDDIAARIAALEGEGKTVVVIRENKTILGLIALRDAPRSDAAEGLARLRALGLRLVMLTGDNGRAATTLGHVLGLEVKAELLPDAKLDAILTYKAEAPIAMVGDGINDAPALAAASVGIAMGCGTDVALETADAALLKNRVTGVAELVALSRATLAIVWQNIALALGFKSVFLATTLWGATPLWTAILADTGAMVLVTGNALRLLRFKVS